LHAFVFEKQSDARNIKHILQNKGVKTSKNTTKTKSSASAQQVATESSSSNSQLCKAEETPHSSDDQKPSRIRTASPNQPDISVLKIISPKRNNKQPRKLQAVNSEAGSKRATPGAGSGQ
ncbi:hypothetical protein COOONC_06558, partial [Cooperia oncophora]